MTYSTVLAKLSTAALSVSSAFSPAPSAQTWLFFHIITDSRLRDHHAFLPSPPNIAHFLSALAVFQEKKIARFGHGTSEETHFVFCFPGRKMIQPSEEKEGDKNILKVVRILE